MKTCDWTSILHWFVVYCHLVQVLAPPASSRCTCWKLLLGSLRDKTSKTCIALTRPLSGSCRFCRLLTLPPPSSHRLPLLSVFLFSTAVLSYTDPACSRSNMPRLRTTAAGPRSSWTCCFLSSQFGLDQGGPVGTSVGDAKYFLD